MHTFTNPTVFPREYYRTPPEATPPDTAINKTTCPCCGQQTEAKIPIVDLNTNVVSWRGQKIKLPAQRAEIMHVLAKKHPQIASRESLIAALWAPDFEPSYGNKVVDVHLCHLRKRLKGTGMSIETVWGRGYRLRLEDTP